jgi:hypothetical protein
MTRGVTGNKRSALSGIVFFTQRGMQEAGKKYRIKMGNNAGIRLDKLQIPINKLQTNFKNKINKLWSPYLWF